MRAFQLGSSWMFGAASLGALSPVKTSLALLLDFSNPIMISRGNYDLAAVVSGLGLVMLGGIVHPSVGLAALMLMRPWIDGYTFKPDNFYFSLGVYFLAALWAARIRWKGTWRNKPAPAGAERFFLPARRQRQRQC